MFILKYFRLDSSSPDENETEIPQEPVADTNGAVNVSRPINLRYLQQN